MYADDFLHFSNNKDMYAKIQKLLKDRFDFKSGTVGIYLEKNNNVVELERLKVSIDQSTY